MQAEAGSGRFGFDNAFPAVREAALHASARS